jgi:DNA modification methylase
MSGILPDIEIVGLVSPTYLAGESTRHGAHACTRNSARESRRWRCRLGGDIIKKSRASAEPRGGGKMTEWAGKNLLCYGDNLGFLTDTELFPNECIDLIYLDPPFNSQQSYNVLFKEASGTPEAAQIKAFEDTWRWDTAANAALTQIHQDPACPATLVDLMKTFMNFLRPSPMLAYLVQMAVRLVHMHRILKPTGSLYLHCDPTASHYLKLVLDAIFGPAKFANEIVWQRTNAHNLRTKHFHKVHDIILFYGKTPDYVWNEQHTSYSQAQLSRYRADTEGRIYTGQDLTMTSSSGKRNFEWRGTRPTKNREWGASVEQLEAWWAEGKILVKKDGTPRLDGLKVYLDEMPGKPVHTIWIDIPRIGNTSRERLGYPTQKPVELLKRIITTSSNPGDVILDPFCGCGTTIDAVETLNRENPDKLPRRWIGIDITHLSINLIKHRLTRFVPPPEYEVIGEPASLAAAEVLAKDDPFQFQFWALGLVGARPAGQKRKKGADLGIDGVRYILDEQKNGAWVSKRMLVQVKGGGVGSKDIRDFVGTLSREKAEMGVFITLQSPTQPMRSEAASAGMYVSPWDKKAYPKVQILTIEELLKDPHRPNPRSLGIPGGTEQHTLPEPPRHKTARSRQRSLGFQQEK